MNIGHEGIIIGTGEIMSLSSSGKNSQKAFKHGMLVSQTLNVMAFAFECPEALGEAPVTNHLAMISPNRHSKNSAAGSSHSEIAGSCHQAGPSPRTPSI